MSTLGLALPPLAEKVAFLSDAASYPEHPSRVEAIETHLSWVFLTDRHAFKLKKPLRLDHRDLASVSARRDHCRLEIALNRRFSEGVYFQAIPLSVDESGRIGFQALGTVIDWLILMRRLPAERMLDRLIRELRLRPGELRPVVERLAHAHAQMPPVTLHAGEFALRLERTITDNARELGHPEVRHLFARIEALCAGQRAFVARSADLLERRMSGGRVVEGHGDLRPEHICLESPPQVIDCLEFSRNLRILDGAEELAFLALECERLGAPWVKGELFDALDAITGQRLPASLVSFYQSLHAAVRAKVAIWHLREPGRADRSRWVTQAQRCIELAESHLIEASS
jgi:aminoglycoside phosphotransferase family enzyme